MHYSSIIADIEEIEQLSPAYFQEHLAFSRLVLWSGSYDNLFLIMTLKETFGKSASAIKGTFDDSKKNNIKVSVKNLVIIAKIK